jgi:hypothetical protein
VENWSCPKHVTDKAKVIKSKYKKLRGVLKKWSHNLSNLKTKIQNISITLQFLDSLEEFRDLSLE